MDNKKKNDLDVKKAISIYRSGLPTCEDDLDRYLLAGLAVCRATLPDDEWNNLSEEEQGYYIWAAAKDFHGVIQMFDFLAPTEKE